MRWTSSPRSLLSSMPTADSAGWATFAAPPTRPRTSSAPGSAAAPMSGVTARPRPAQRPGPDERAALAAEPAARHEHHPFDVLRELVGELHDHAAAERVPHERRPLDIESLDKVAQPTCKGPDRVVSAQPSRRAMAGQVGGDHVEALGEPAHDRRPLEGVAGYA